MQWRAPLGYPTRRAGQPSTPSPDASVITTSSSCSDNCEHLLDVVATLLDSLLGHCPAVRLLATSREPLRIAAETTWQVPSLLLTDEAIELFTDRARSVRRDFKVTDDNATIVAEICRRLYGMPLAIELAAARVRALSPTEVLDGSTTGSGC